MRKIELSREELLQVIKEIDRAELETALADGGQLVHPLTQQGFNGATTEEVDEWVDSLPESELRDALKAATKIAMMAAIIPVMKLVDKAAASKLAIKERGQRGGVARLVRNEDAREKAEAMEAIRQEWESLKRPGGPFARQQAMKYQASGLDISEGGIKNAITRWRKEEPRDE